MPFAQFGYPHMGKDAFRAQFPADFISEAIDQTRGWFYGLLAISTLLFGDQRDESHMPASNIPRPDGGHPYKSCIVLGHVMGEDGKKMSKRLKNYPEPKVIFDEYGADAMRWFFLSAQSPWTSSRFADVSEDDVRRFQRDPEFREQVRQRRGEPELKSIEHDQPIRDAQREFLVRLYNVFSFFNIYANIDGFDPDRHEGTEARRHEEPRASARPDATGWRPVSERSQIDRWITSELHSTVKFVSDRMDRFENYPAAGRLKDFLDALSNWYVRRSRERFWRPVHACEGTGGPASGRSATDQRSVPQDQDKWDAYNTLYEALVTLSKLIAPFTPFLAETMYQNLVRHEGTKARRHEGEGKDPLCPLSVHLCDYPEADEALIDETLAQEMDLVRQVVSTGRAARTSAKLKVRQPLAQVEVILAWKEYEQRLQAHTDLIAEELNVKKVEFTHEADHYVQYQIKPNFKALGPKFGKLAPKVGAALNSLDDPAAARKNLLSEGELSLTVDGQAVTLTKDEVSIRLEAKAGWAAAQSRAGVVVVSTELTPELREEGLMRELIHHVQGLRRQQDLPYEARVTLHVTGPDDFLEIVRRFTDTISAECLAERIEFTTPTVGDVLTAKIEHHQVKLAIHTV